jgi:hypothetical protein
MENKNLDIHKHWKSEVKSDLLDFKQPTSTHAKQGKERIRLVSRISGLQRPYE